MRRVAFSIGTQVVALLAVLLAACSSKSVLHEHQLHTLLQCPCPTIAPLAQYPLPAEVQCCAQTGAYMGSLAVGPDGNVWSPELEANMIARVTPAGVVTEFPIPTANALPESLTVGPDGNLWFGEAIATAQAVARITTTGTVTEFPLPPPLNTAQNVQGDTFGFITTGPDGNLWFTHPGANVIGVMNASGQVLKTYPIPTADSDASFIITGPDGNMWFVEEVGNKIARITMSGTISEFVVPTSNSHPKNLIVGPDNNLWFPEIEGGNVGQVTMSGVITEFPMVADPTVHRLRRITVTPDGAMWLVEADVAPPWNSEIGTFNIAGSETNLWEVGGEPRAIIAGPDGSPWFGDEATENVVRL